MSGRRILLSCFLTAVWLPPALSAADQPAPAPAPLAAQEEVPWNDLLKLETHGFASFGYLRTWGNNWFDDDTRDGTTEFYEAALNVIARPLDRLRLGAQLFTRDLGRYDNGRVSLDWAYADYRAHDAFGVQAGRVKFPVGLYTEQLDIDAARTAVFLAPAIYPLRSRDLFISIDGAKLYGSLDLRAAGRVEYAFFAGDSPIDLDAGSVGYFSDLGLGDPIRLMDARWSAGGMLHWDTPLEGFGVRVSLADLHDLRIHGDLPALGATIETTAGNYYYGVVSLVYETGPFTVALEGSRARGRGRSEIQPLGLVEPLHDDSGGGYLSVTWHARPWLELYGAYERSYSDVLERSLDRATTLVFALAVMPLDHWSLKAEFRDVRGTFGVLPADNPGGMDNHWQVLALKTTVDF